MKNKPNAFVKAVWLSLLFCIILGQGGAARVRIKDIADIRGLSSVQLVGYSLVVGLDGTGDGRRSLFTQQSIRNMLQNFIYLKLERFLQSDDIRIVVFQHIEDKLRAVAPTVCPIICRAVTDVE